LIQAMSSPIVVTFQPSMPAGGISIAKLVFRRRSGTPRDIVLAALRRRHAEDQHVLGEPALVASHRRGDPQREALLAEQRVAAVARAVAPDLLRFRVVDDVLGRVARPGDILLPGSSGAPTVCMQGTKWPSLPSTSRTARPMRVMIFMLTATYALSDSSTPMWAIGEPSGPIENGTTYIVRPRIAPRNRPGCPSLPVSSRARISAGSIQLLVGPGVFGTRRADEGPVLDPGDVARAAAGEVAVRPQLRIEPLEGAGGTSCAHSRSYSAWLPSHQ
jgi:hypothetical protein